MQSHFSKARLAAHRRHGVTALEASIALMMVLVITFGSFEFGYFFYVKHALSDAAAAGAWAASLSSGTNTTVSSAISTTLASAKLSNSGYSVTTSPTDVSTAPAGTIVSVTITTTWGTVGKGISPMHFISTTKSVTGISVMTKQASTALSS